MSLEKITSAEQLEQIYHDAYEKIKLRFNKQQKQEEIDQYHILTCSGTGCSASKSQNIIKRLDEELKKQNLDDKVKVFKTGCFGFCKLGPIVVMHPQQTFYCQVSEDDVDDLIESHIKNHQVVKRLLYKGSDNKIKEAIDEIDFFNYQQRIALRNCGVINPEDISEYIANDGYLTLAKILKEQQDPKEIISEITKSGLRGRGGGGFPTGKKWEFATSYENDSKFVVCNADEGDPGAFMDRSILEGDPHSIIEAMIISGYCIGANQGYIYVRAEYPVAVKRIEIAIEQAKQSGLLGENILNSGFYFDLGIRLGAGAFVCGEETALISSIEGDRGMSRLKPPFPAEKGLWDKPTIINNVETLANVPIILQNGADWFKGFGTEKSSGTKVFALNGKIKNSGLIEVPMGITLGEVINEVGGGMASKRRQFKAVLTGGPSGGCLTEKHLDASVDFDTLVQLGSMMGSGGMIVLDDRDCMVDIAKFYMDFIVDESCGKCTPCREGTKQMYNILDKITKGKAVLEDIDQLEKLAKLVKRSSLCGLGQTAPNPVLSTLENFRDEYIAHVVDKRCEASVCKDLIKQYVITDACIGCTLCAKRCPTNCITGERKEMHFINVDNCIKCGTCLDGCPVDAIITEGVLM